jgi:hypothetical protein
MGKPSSIWLAEEVTLLRDNPDLEPRVLAEKLGRSIHSVAQKRHKLANPSVNTPSAPRLTAEFDCRPSGWYDENVGALLIDYKPAFDAWVHYHRYVEIKYTGFKNSLLGGIFFLRCRRDADAL